MSWDPYSVLGVSKTATEKEIKSAYRKLAKELHPDVRPDDKAAEARFKKVSAAFGLLGDAEKRARYDRGEIDADGNERATFNPGGFGGGAGGYNTRGGQQRPGPDVFEDLFGGMFGQGGARGRGFGPSKGSDVRYRLDVDFEDAVNGGSRRVTVADGRTLDINIPAGVTTGQVLRLKAQGEAGPPGTSPGDALIEITVKSSNVYERDGDNVRMEQKISLAEAVEGAKVTVRTPSGNLAVNVPAGSNTGSLLRLKGKGVQVKPKPGDLLVRLMVTLPEKPDAAIKEFLKGWDQRDEAVRK